MSISNISLDTLVTPSKSVEVPFPEKDGFVVTVTFLSREELIKLRKACITTKFDRKSRQPVESIDDELFLKNYVNSVVKGWKGLKFTYLNELMLVDLDSVNPEDELAYTEANALILMKNSAEFDSFITDVVGDLSNFTKFSSAYSEKS